MIFRNFIDSFISRSTYRQIYDLNLYNLKFLVPVKHHENQLAMVPQQDRLVQEDPVIREERKVFRDQHLIPV